MINELVSRPNIQEFLNKYPSSRWKELITDLFEIGVLNLKNSYNRYQFSRNELCGILYDLENSSSAQAPLPTPKRNPSYDYRHALRSNPRYPQSYDTQDQRYSPRYDDTLKSVSQMLQIFQEYRKNICLIISNSEISTKKYRAEIEHIFQIKFRINKIILSTLEINELELLDKIEKFKEDMPFIKNLNLKTSDLIRIIEPKFDLDFIDDRENYINEFQNGLKIFLEELSKATEKDLKRALYFGLRDFKDNLIKKYAEIIKGKKADNDKIITELIMLNNAIFAQFIRFKEKVEPELDTQTKDLNGEYIRYKKCPNCGIIWFLLCGSQNTLCGARSNALDIIYGKYIEYSVKFINGIITIQKIEIENKNTNTEKKRLGLTEEEKLENQKRGGKALIKPIGCGSELKWSEMEDVTDQVLNHLKEIYDNYDNVIIDISKEFNINL
jgi:hypothetical protein